MFKSRIIQGVKHIDPLSESITEQYFLDGYEEAERVTEIIDEEECTIVSYKGEHSNEVLVKRPNGVVTLFSFGVKLIEWIERDDSSIGTITFYENGIIKLVQVRNEAETDIVHITNDIEGAVLEYEDINFLIQDDHNLFNYNNIKEIRQVLKIYKKILKLYKKSKL